MAEKRKPVRKTAGYVLRSYIPITSAIGPDNYKKSFESCKSIIKGVFKRSKATNPETFDEALERMSITEVDLKKRYIDYQKMYYLFMFLSLGLFFYSFYLLFIGYYFALFLGLAVTALSLVQAFKRHFWMFQVRQRRLGCTFREWWNDLNGKAVSK